jgi:hypothetical protein
MVHMTNILGTVKWLAYSAGNMMDDITVPVYFVSVATLYFCYFVIFFKIVDVNHKYVAFLQMIIHVFVCLFLLIRFNPLIRPVLRKYDSNIIFTSAILLLSNVVLIHPETTLRTAFGI